MKSIFLGVVQGLTEFLPVSSSGHLAVFEHFLGAKQPGVLMEVLLHLGTLVAVVIYFRKDLLSLTLSFFRWICETIGLRKKADADDLYERDKRLIVAIIIASIPTGLMGIFAKDWFESLFSRIDLIGVAMLITAVILVLGETLSIRRVAPKTEEASPAKSFLIGMAQGVAIAPGISRSGATISAGLALGLNPEAAARFSFLLSIPAILGAAVLKAKDISGLDAGSVWGYAAGAVAAAVVGYLSIGLLIRAARAVKLRWFALYCAIFGAAVIVASAIGY